MFSEKPLRLFQSCSFCTVPLLLCAGKHDENWCFWHLISLFACWRCSTVYLLVLYMSHKNIYAYLIKMCWRLLCSAKLSILPLWIENRVISEIEGEGLIFLISIMGSLKFHFILEFYVISSVLISDSELNSFSESSVNKSSWDWQGFFQSMDLKIMHLFRQCCCSSISSCSWGTVMMISMMNVSYCRVWQFSGNSVHCLDLLKIYLFSVLQNWSKM